MTLDEAIKHCLEVAEHNEMLIKRGYAGGCNSHDCSERAADHRQLAEWLTELKEAKELLREAVSNLYYNFHYASKAEIRLCYCDKCLNDAKCSKDIDKCKCKFVWWKRDEALKLIGGATDET